MRPRVKIVRRPAELERRYGVPTAQRVEAFRVDCEVIETEDFMRWEYLENVLRLRGVEHG